MNKGEISFISWKRERNFAEEHAFSFLDAPICIFHAVQSGCNNKNIQRTYRFYEFPPRSMKPERGLFFLMPPQMSIKERKRTALMPWHEGNTILITHFSERVSPLLLPLSQLPRMEAPQRLGAVFTIGIPETPAHLSIRHGMMGLLE